jgi:hypothetical protein
MTKSCIKKAFLIPYSVAKEQIKKLVKIDEIRGKKTQS